MPSIEERNARIEREDAEKRAQQQAEADRRMAAEQAARELAKTKAVEAQTVLAELGPKLGDVIKDLSRLEQLRGPGILVDDIRDALRAANIDVYSWRSLTPLGEVGNPTPPRPWPPYRLG